jgi:hypothetical protein
MKLYLIAYPCKIDPVSPSVDEGMGGCARLCMKLPHTPDHAGKKS